MEGVKVQIRSTKALSQFIEKGRLATLRPYPYEKIYGQVSVNKKYRARIVVVFVNPGRDILERFVNISGYSTLDEWLKVTHHSFKGIPNRLVIIQKIDEN